VKRMLRTLGIVEACYASDRTRSQAGRKLGGKPVLERVVRRATDCQRLDGVIVVTSDAPENGFVSSLIPRDVPVYVGRKPDALACFAAAVEEYPAESVVRIGTDCPFLDPALVDRLVRVAEENPGNDYISYCSRDGRPAILSPVGVYAEWFTAEALHRAARKATSPMDRREVTRYLYSHPEKFSLRLVQAPEKIDREDVRLTVDREEDFENALAIVEALGPDELDWQRIAQLLDHQPALRKRMAMLNQAHGRR
jgi:spore coat polysaccharide biosynthesis protein SpsF